MLSVKDPTDAMEAKALSYAQNRTDIFSNSWGPADYGWVIEGPGKLTLKALQDGVKWVKIKLLETTTIDILLLLVAVIVK